MFKIAVTIITYNEESNIRRCLESVKWADEIILVDSNSTDNTVNIAKEYTDKIFIHSWLGYGRQKNICADKASYDWIFNIDADEEIPAELKDSIIKLKGKINNYKAYKVKRKNYFGCYWVKYGGWYPDYITRLYNKNYCRFNERDVHESIICKDTTGIINNSLNHYTYKNMSDYINRMNLYSSLSAQNMKNDGKKPKMTDIILHPIFVFFKQYLMKKGFKDGIIGIFLSISSSYYTFLKYIKLMELQSNKD